MAFSISNSLYTVKLSKVHISLIYTFLNIFYLKLESPANHISCTNVLFYYHSIDILPGNIICSLFYSVKLLCAMHPRTKIVWSYYYRSPWMHLSNCLLNYIFINNYICKFDYYYFFKINIQITFILSFMQYFSYI